MTTQHTPAPFLVIANNGTHGTYIKSAITGESVCDLYVMTESKKLSQFMESEPLDFANAESNARLIAAAPELLEALIELDQWAQAQQEYPQGTFAIVQEAINKARGV